MKHIALRVAVLIFHVAVGYAQSDTARTISYPVVVEGDTVFAFARSLGPFSALQRAQALQTKLEEVIRTPSLSIESVRVVSSQYFETLLCDTLVLMAITDDDVPQGTVRAEFARGLAARLTMFIQQQHEQYTFRSLIEHLGIVAALFIALVLGLWGMARVFPRVYEKLESWEGSLFRPIRFRSQEILAAGTMSGIVILIARGIRLALVLAAFYYFIIYALSLFPWTRGWDVKPILRGVLYSILVTAAAAAILKGMNTFLRAFTARTRRWKGSLIKPIRIKTIEILSADRIVELLRFGAKIFHLTALIVTGYFFITIIFSLFDFSKTWASALINYILDPLGRVFSAFVQYLPNLFFILVIIGVTRFVIKAVHFVFNEIEKGTLAFPSFPAEWAEPTYKIARFLVIAFAGIVIFPYLPGSDSPAFQGVSIFLGVLFSLGSTSAIANVVAGVVLTYMRPFRIGDRVKIADTIGDVIEKTLLVTRVRTIKNVDITIPNSMVLGSHIVNFSSSATERGLILHSTVTIGYDVPWKQVHELLISAARETENILKEPEPFVLQTSLDDFYVSYELNAYTDKPSVMAKTYSTLHAKVQDKFNQAGVEIMSPHYSAMRDGNQTTIPTDHLPKNYTAPGFRIFPFGNVETKTHDDPNTK